MTGFDLSTISDVYVGSTQHSSIYLGSTLIWQANSLPYDAEIEYLQADGTQYIDTGVIPDSTIVVDTKISAQGKDCLSGSELIYNSNGRFKWGSNGNGRLYYGWGNNNFANSTLLMDINTPYTYHLQQSNQYVKDNADTTVLNSSNTTLTRFNDQPITLFRVTNGSTIKQYSGTGAVRVYYCNITKSSDNTNMQLIPVRVGQVGYLYDKISGQLYGNSGSGDFVLGPDKTV